MGFKPGIHRRQSIRLRDYDYSSVGAYFVTICTAGRECLFGNIVDGEMQLNAFGLLARQCWDDIPKHFPHVALDASVIMPNHVHGIVMIVDFDGAKGVGAKPVGAKNFSPLQRPNPCGTSKTIGSIVRGFKIGVTKWMRENTPIHDVWQRNYHERVIRDERELTEIRQYIADNPGRWFEDENHPARV